MQRFIGILKTIKTPNNMHIDTGSLHINSTIWDKNLTWWEESIPYVSTCHTLCCADCIPFALYYLGLISYYCHEHSHLSTCDLQEPECSTTIHNQKPSNRTISEEEEVDKMMEQKMKEEEERKRTKEMEERMSLEETKEQVGGL